MTETMRDGLRPVIDDDARLLLLGSFPSAQSLVAGEYYANPRNRFWPLLADVLGFDVGAPYRERIDALQRHGVALWDVVHSCRRTGSLDAKIDRKTLVVNDFESFFARYPGIERVFVNGATADQLFARYVTTRAPATRLPSSSSALAIPLEKKLVAWRQIASS